MNSGVCCSSTVTSMVLAALLRSQRNPPRNSRSRSSSRGHFSCRVTTREQCRQQSPWRLPRTSFLPIRSSSVTLHSTGSPRASGIVHSGTSSGLCRACARTPVSPGGVRSCYGSLASQRLEPQHLLLCPLRKRKIDSGRSHLQDLVRMRSKDNLIGFAAQLELERLASLATE